MLELFAKLLIQGMDAFIKDGLSYFRYSIAISIFVAALFCTITYYFPYFWNKAYHKTSLCIILAFFSFILTLIATFTICALNFSSSYFAEQLNEYIGFSIGETILSIVIFYLLMQGALFIILSISAYKDIKVFR